MVSSPSPGWRTIRIALTAVFLFGMVAGGGHARTSDREWQKPGRNAGPIDWEAPHVPGELLVALPDAETPAVQARLASAGMPVIEAMPQLNLALVRVAEADSAPLAQEPEALAQAADRAQALGASWSEPNYLFALDFAPDDPDYPRYQQPYLNRLEMGAAWDKTTGRPEIIIAILDTGINMAHPDLSGGIWTNPGEIAGNGLDDDGNGFVDDIHGWDFAGDDNLPDDDHGHGTHVAGIAGARISNTTGIAGMAGNATLMPVDVFGGGIGTYADLIQGILYAADNGAHVINMSLGATSYSRGEEVAVNYAWDRGSVVVASAGNSGREADNYPAAHANVIAVSATDSLDQRAGFSSWGDFVDVAAPGLSIWSSVGWGYGYKSGTSMAAPHVSGLAALIRSADPTLTTAEVRALIEQNADDLGDTGPDKLFGHGRINARRTLEGVAVVPGPMPITPPVPDPTWPIGCREIVQNGGFDNGIVIPWQTDAVNVSTITGSTGQSTWAAQFPGGISSHNGMTQTLTVPQKTMAATLTFDFRIETNESGWGSSPHAPWDDSFTVELRRTDGTVLRSLLRTGNTADTSRSGLAWDEYLYPLNAEDLALLHTNQPIVLAFEAQNDDDNNATTVWVDDVQLCALSENSVFLPYLSH